MSIFYQSAQCRGERRQAHYFLYGWLDVLLTRGQYADQFHRCPQNSTSVLPLPDEESNVSIATISMEDGQYIFNQAKRDPTGFKISFPSTKHLYGKH
jgi:hypothetical protein